MSDKNEEIIQAIKNAFYPLDYARWQADELLDEVFNVIRDLNV